MRVLDVGCGPGTITAGLAAAVVPARQNGMPRSVASVEDVLALCREYVDERIDRHHRAIVAAHAAYLQEMSR